MATKMNTKEKAGYHHGDLESAFIAQAQSLVAKFGVEKISLREISSQLGVSPSAAYHHFSDKEALLSAVAQQAFQELGQQMHEAVGKFQGKGLVAARRRFRATGESYVHYALKNRNLFLLAFGPYCQGEVYPKEETLAWQCLVNSLNELDELGYINPKIRPYAEILAWSAIHGISNLLLDELMPLEAVEPLLDSIEIAIRAEK
jgi:AcrR family transcriptional regulator